jgi:hypothetical protein
VTFDQYPYVASDRGLIREGMIADITVFDPTTVTDKATFERQHQYPVGIDYAIVNGQLSLQKANGQESGLAGYSFGGSPLETSPTFIGLQIKKETKENETHRPPMR